MNVWLDACLAAPPLANVFTYFAQSNAAGQVIVILLILFSFVAWSLMLEKYFELKRVRALNLGFARKLGRTPSVTSMEEFAHRHTYSPYIALARDAVEAHARARSSGSRSTRFSQVENALQRGVAEHSNFYESKMVMLGSIVTGAPFLGLLGTVWGVMDSFGAVALQSSAVTLQMLAPGVAGALLTTVAGLCVAIPSVFGYNYLLGQTKIMITDLENFASALADRMEIELGDSKE